MRPCSRKSCSKFATYGVAVKIIIPDINRPCIIMPDIVVCGLHKKKIKFKDIFNNQGIQYLKDCLRAVLEHHRIYEMPNIEDKSELDFIPMVNMN